MRCDIYRRYCESSGFNAKASILTVLWSICSARGDGRCRGSSMCSQQQWGAHAVMSGVTRQRFQNTAVNKVKVSRFAGRRLVFMSRTVHRWSNVQNKHQIYMGGGCFYFLDFKELTRWDLVRATFLSRIILFLCFLLIFCRFHRRNENLGFLNAVLERKMWPSTQQMPETITSKIFFVILYLLLLFR